MKIKKILVMLCLCILFIPIVTFAKTSEDGLQVTSNWVLPSQVQCYNSSKQEITTGFNSNSYEVEGFYGKSYYNCYGGTDSYTSVNIGQLMQSNYLYAITFYVGNTNSLIPVSNGDIGLGDYPLSAMNDNPNKSNVVIYSHKVAGNYTFQQPTTSSLIEIKYSQIYYVFKVKNNGTVFNFHLYYNSTPSNIWFFGYNIYPLGYANNLSDSDIKNAINDSDLASATSVNEVQESVNELKQDINELNSTQKETNEKLDNIDTTLNDSDTSEATSSAGEFFTGFESNDFGLTSIITAPLNLIKSITSATCSPLPLQVPFLENQTINLPCMSSIYEEHFGTVLTVYQTATFGLIAYWVCVNIVSMVKGFKDPDSDKIEVIDL